MEITNLDMYQRLRDFHVPAPVLDEIFAHEEDLAILTDAWQALENEGLKGDEIAIHLSKLFFKALNINPDQESAEK